MVLAASILSTENVIAVLPKVFINPMPNKTDRLVTN